MNLSEILKSGLAGTVSSFLVKVSAEKRRALAATAGDALGDLVYKTGTPLDDAWLPPVADDLIVLLETAKESLADNHRAAGDLTAVAGLDRAAVAGLDLADSQR